jgi:periplasmic protein TonB
LFRVGNGVSPPRQIYQREPEFSEAARGIKFQGTGILGLTVSADGTPTSIHILSPLGAGLDANAVHAVEGWKFKPAEKDGQPVAVVIAVEIDFRRYRGN